jgi:tryptophan synthase beta subunit
MLPSLESGAAVVINLSGRGDKDLDIVAGFDA